MFADESVDSVDFVESVGFVVLLMIVLVIMKMTGSELSSMKMPEFVPVPKLRKTLGPAVPSM